MSDLIEQIREQLYIANLIALANYRAPRTTGEHRDILASEIMSALERSRGES